MSAYREFLEGKIKMAQQSGFLVPMQEINPALKPHTRVIVQWALQGGCRAIFAAFGLHKTATQLEMMRQIGMREGGLRLIVLPLGVRQEFKAEIAERFTGDCAMKVKFIRGADEIEDEGTVYLTNYETIRDGRLDPNLFVAASLDEADVLRSFGSKTYQTFLDLFSKVRYRFVATATPSPNRLKELIHYAGFLGIMDTGQSLTRFFQRDSTKANKLTLYPHKEREFWMWVSSWALFIQRPSDLGFSDEGYVLPEMDIRYHEVSTDHGTAGHDRDGQAMMFQDAAFSLQSASAEKRNSLDRRVAMAMDIVNQDPDDHFILWHDLEAERHAIQKAAPGAVSVWGSQDLDEREQRIIDFSNGRFRLLSTKPIIAGSGCNFQRHCHREIFVGIGFKFKDFIQAIHRVQRFQQKHRVRIDIIYSEAERGILRTLKQKWNQHDDMVKKMTDIIKKYGLNHIEMAEALQRSIGVERVEVVGDRYRVANNDCVEETAAMDSESVDLVVTSIPFANHYEYTPSYNDFGHTDDNDHFWKQMDYLTPELLRVLRPGRLYCCHVKDRILFGNVTGAGAPTVSPFHAEAIFHAKRHGFDYMGMITVVTDVVRENNQTYRLGWSEQCKDGTKMGVGSPEYVLLFRKPQTDRSKGYADTPVRKSKDDYTRARWQVDAHAYWRSSGNRLLTADEMSTYSPDQIAKVFKQFSLANVYDYEHHIHLGEKLDAVGALPSTFMTLAPGSHADHVWDDVNRMRTLNGNQTQKGLQNHVCPLQIDIVDRLITRYSNEGETVYDPFGGLMTVPFRAIKLGRYGMASELNASYFLDGVQYLKQAEIEAMTPTLFDFEDDEKGAA